MAIAHHPEPGATDRPTPLEGYLGLLRERLGPSQALEPAELSGVVVAIAAALFEAVDASGRSAGDAALLSGDFGEPLPLGDLDPRAHLGGAAATFAADLIGRAHEVLIDPGGRRSRGAFYTPRMVAEGIVEVATTGWQRSRGDIRVCDPACGGGAFLLAAGRFLESGEGDGRARHPSRSELVGNALWGTDIDPLAAAVTDAALRLWVAEAGEVAPPTNVTCADGLEVEGLGPPFDLVIGNPPFQGQLSSRTARSREALQRLRERLGPIVHGYVDTAVLFLASGLAAVGEGGRVALVQPGSFLAARDATRSRRALVGSGRLVALWWPGQALFDATVRVCVPVIERRSGPLPSERSTVTVTRWVGPERAVAAPATVELESLRSEPTWGALVADLRGIPAVQLSGARRLGDMARATAGFRSQFYGLAPFVVDEPEPHPGTEARGGERAWPHLVTAGLVDPARCLWGSQPARFAGRRLTAPRVDMARLAAENPSLAAWAEARLVPKVLVATQTQVIEAVVDAAGTWWPSVPVVSVEPQDPEATWRLCAVLLSPPVTAWAMARYGGSAQSEDSLKLAASQLLDVPLPERGEPWERAVAHVQAGAAAAAQGDGSAWAQSLDAAGQAMCEAYGATEEVWHWWRARLPRFRSGSHPPG